MLELLIAAASLTAVDAERAFARDARRIGQWTAFRKYADDTAVMFTPQAIWAHEFQYQTWKENPAPILEAVRGYLATDYDYPKAIQAVRDDLEAAKRELMDDVPEGEGKDRLRGALDLSLRMNPLTPDHHFYIDQGTNARVRLVLIAIGKKLVEAGVLDDPEDVMFLRYNELRVLMFNPDEIDAREIVSDRRDEQEDAYEVRPPEWIGTATQRDSSA